MKQFFAVLLAALALNIPVSAAWVNVTANLAGKSCACGNVYCMGAVPGQNKVIVGICGNIGMFATTDNGTSWQPLGTSSNWVDPQTIVFDKDNPNTFWEIGIHGGQIHKTTDGGATFTLLSTSPSGDGMGVDMSDPLRKTIVGGAHEGSGLKKSTDGGNTWSDITAGTSGWTNFPVVVNSQIFIEGSTNSGIYRTTNGGSSWSQVSTSSVTNSEACIAPNGDIYFIKAGSQAMLKSTDQGATWTSLAKSGDNGATFDNPIVMPDNSIVAAGAAGLIQCSDGKTWKTIVATLPSTGLIKGQIAYNSVAKSFYMYFWDCTSKVPAGAIWKFDYATETSLPLVKANTVVRHTSAKVYDIRGRLIRKSDMGANAHTLKLSSGSGSVAIGQDR
jgi:photosystem II stability/assembly factor-like uncharacterized protein